MLLTNHVHHGLSLICLVLLGPLLFNILQPVDLGDIFSHYINQVRHGKVHDIVSPSQLHDDVWMEKVIAVEETGSEAVMVAILQEPLQELLSRVGVFALGCILHGVLSDGLHW